MTKANKDVGSTCLLVHVILQVTGIITSMFKILITDLRPVGHKRTHTAVAAAGNLQKRVLSGCRRHQ